MAPCSELQVILAWVSQVDDLSVRWSVSNENATYFYLFVSPAIISIKIAKLVLTLPHSNADEERVFSFVKHNKTPYRDALNINSTLSSILTVKMASKEPCFKFEPTSEVLTASKKATWSYNQAHVQKRK